MSIDNTKSQILTSALELFALNGFTATSVKDIADHAKANPSLINYHFGSKDGLYEACLKVEANTFTSFFDRHIGDFSNKDEYRLKLKMLIEKLIASSEENKFIERIIRREIDLEPIHPAILDVFKKTTLPLYERTILFIKKGQGAGYIRSDLDAKQICVLFLGSIQHVIRTDHLRKKLFGVSISDKKEQSSLTNTTIEIFFNGLAKKVEDKPLRITPTNDLSI